MTTESTFDPNDDSPLDPEIEDIEALKAEIDQLKAQSLIERADLDNQRKRIARDIDTARRFANEKLLSEIIPVFDSLEAGLANASADDPLRAGLELTLKQLRDVTARNGLAEIAPMPGDVFNPEHHNAVSQQPVEGIASGAVVQAFQKGYLLNDRLLRPAMVVVAP